MTQKWKNITIVACAAALLVSCNDSQQNTGGAIVLGDSSTIVTEGDKEQLKDLVIDLQPVIPPAADQDEDEKPADTPTVAAEQPQASPQPVAIPSGPGLKAEFGEVTVMIPGLDIKQGGAKNLKKAHGVSYLLTNGTINGATLIVSGTVTKVSQRYQSIVVMSSDVGELPLESLIYLSQWEEVKSTNNSYKITGLDTKSLTYRDASARDIRNAVEREAKSRRLSRKKIQDLVSDVHKARSVNQKPLHGELRTAMWKIDGKDENGKFYSKQIRIDIPM